MKDEEVKIELIGDVYTITGIRGSRQLIDFYKQVVQKNYEKYVAITKEGIKYCFDSNTNRALRLEDNKEYALNPAYRPIKTEDAQEEKLVESEDKVDLEIKPEVINNEVSTETNAVEDFIQDAESNKIIVNPNESTVDITIINTDKDYNIKSCESKVEALPADYELIRLEYEQTINSLKEELNLHKERADMAEKDLNDLRTIKVLNEGRIQEFESELVSKIEEIESLKNELDAFKKSIEDKNIFENIDTDTLIQMLHKKGYTVTISLVNG